LDAAVAALVPWDLVPASSEPGRRQQWTPYFAGIVCFDSYSELRLHVVVNLLMR